MHGKRLLTAAVLLPVFYLYISRLSPFFFLLLLAAVTALAQREFSGMYRAPRLVSALGTAAGALFLLSAYILTSPSGKLASPVFAAFYPVLFMFSFMLIASARLFSARNPESALKDLAPVLTGLVYIPNLLLPQWFLRLDGYQWIFFLYGCVWISDSFAYYIGKGMGKRKLYREVSPNKTVEGAAGSVLGGMISAIVLGKVFVHDSRILFLLVAGFAIGSVTIVGDLVESMFKRDAGVKDSGSLIPGHGGILDKIDGVLFAGPVLCLLKWIL